MEYKDTLNFVLSIVDQEKNTIEQGLEKAREEMSLIIKDIDSALASISPINTLEEFYGVLNNLKFKHIKIFERINTDSSKIFILRIVDTYREFYISCGKLNFLRMKTTLQRNLVNIKEGFEKVIENYIEIRGLFVMKNLIEQKMCDLYHPELENYLNLDSLSTQMIRFQ